ncbi:MAG: hypothetical protein QRY71_03785 [Candidatus Rhabdochlamydia sp.]
MTHIPHNYPNKRAQINRDTPQSDASFLDAENTLTTTANKVNVAANMALSPEQSSDEEKKVESFFSSYNSSDFNSYRNAHSSPSHGERISIVETHLSQENTIIYASEEEYDFTPERTPTPHYLENEEGLNQSPLLNAVAEENPLREHPVVNENLIRNATTHADEEEPTPPPRYTPYPQEVIQRSQSSHQENKNYLSLNLSSIREAEASSSIPVTLSRHHTASSSPSEESPAIDETLIMQIMDNLLSLKLPTNYISLDILSEKYALLFGNFEEASVKMVLTHRPIASSLKTLSSLYHSFTRLKDYTNFQAIEEAYTKHTETYPALYSPPPLKQFCNPLLLSRIRSTLQENPLYKIHDWTGISSDKNLFVIRNERDIPAWIFKPVAEPTHLQYELCALALNDEEQFPLPRSLGIQLLDQPGIATSFIIDAVPLSTLKENPKSLLPLIDLQKILIFDLLFCNQNRTSSNLLIQYDTQEGNLLVKGYGISHENCLQKNDGIKIDYLDVFSSSDFFAQEIHSLFSETACEKYATIMDEFGIDPSMIMWMRYVGKTLRLKASQFTLHTLAIKLRNKFDAFE